VSWTKAELIAEAFGELAIAGYDFDLTPEEKQAALRRMDAMVASWEARGVRLGYKLPASPSTSSVNDAAGIQDRAAEAVYMNLAVNLAAGKGKTLTAATLAAAKAAYDVLLYAAAKPQRQQLRGGMPLGAGSAFVGVFTSTPTHEPLGVSPGGDLTIASE